MGAEPTPVYVCQNCGHEHPKWQGKCGDCKSWNTLRERLPERERRSGAGSGGTDPSGGTVETGDGPVEMGSIEETETDRTSTGIGELDRVLGGGLVPGGVVLLGGDPGIGKSTLSLQAGARIAGREGADVLYVSGEESLSQLKMRADRLGVSADSILVLGETNLERTAATIREVEPELVVVDSIQTLTSEEYDSSPGSVVQLREVTGDLTQLAKGMQTPTLLIGHVTKEGAIAGPKVLEHMVDTVLYFEGRSETEHRVLRAVKNRYGSTDEIGVFSMRQRGLEEVENPSATFLEERPPEAPGSAVVPVVEGTRPLLVEVQGLVSPTNYGPPGVTAVGVDRNRAVLLLNIIEKRTGLEVTGQDVFVNVAGGMRLDEPASDLGIAAAILSSYLDRPLPSEALVVGELGLTGEVRAVSRLVPRLREGENLGFGRAVLPRGNAEALEKAETPEGQTVFDDGGLDFARTLADVIRSLFGKDVLA